nr:hypothetical protein [Tanacetum cinerariifolium]
MICLIFTSITLNSIWIGDTYRVHANAEEKLRGEIILATKTLHQYPEEYFRRSLKEFKKVQEMILKELLESYK